MSKNKKSLKQIFQGKVMGENASFFEKLTFKTANPLLESSLTQQIRFEQLGNCPEHLKLKNLEYDLENTIKESIAKNPKDRFAFLKGVMHHYKP